MSLAVLVPVLARPQNVAPLVAAFNATVRDARIVFIADPDDTAEQEAILKTDASMILLGGSYAVKINAAVRATTTDWLLLAADDVVPHAGWFEAALAVAVRTDTQVIGLNDLIPRPERPQHATHFLLRRDAAELPCIDGARGPLCERYGHWRTDDELIATARKRDMYAYAPDAIVEHRHPMTGKAPDDATYRKGRRTARQDGRTFMRRARLWA